MTFVQFLFVAVTGYISQFDQDRPPLFLRPNRVPIRRWMFNILLFFTINVLNNHAFSYNISVPIHIILRSGGSITTLAAGFLWGKRFSRIQVIAVTLLTIGVIIAAWSDQQSKVCATLLFVLYLANNRFRKMYRPRKKRHLSAQGLASSSWPRYCRPSWAYIQRKRIKNTGRTGKKTYFTRTYSPYPYSYLSSLP